MGKVNESVTGLPTSAAVGSVETLPETRYRSHEPSQGAHRPDIALPSTGVRFLPGQ